APHAVRGEPLDLAQRGADREVRLLVRQRADPDLEQPRAARHIHRRHPALATLGEGLDIRVVAVVESAYLADHLEEPADLLAVLAEPGARDRERVEVSLAAGDLDRKAEADRRVGPGLVDQQHLVTLDRRGRDRRRLPRRITGRQLVARPAD